MALNKIQIIDLNEVCESLQGLQIGVTRFSNTLQLISVVLLPCVTSQFCVFIFLLTGRTDGIT